MPTFTIRRSQNRFLKNDIYSDYDGCHRQRVKRSSYLSAHISTFRPVLITAVS
jgi:hypothetical protein